MIRTLLNSFSLFNDSRTIYLNQDGSVLSINDQLAKTKGYSRAAVIGKSYSILSSGIEKDDEYFKSLLTIAAKKGKVRYKAVTSENGKQRKSNVTLEAIHDEKKRVIGYTVTL